MARAEARRVEVRLVRRLPAHAARLRGRAARVAGESRSPTSWRRPAATVDGPLRPLAGRGLDHHRARRRADPAGPQRVEGAGHHRRLRHRRRHPGAAELRATSTSSPDSCTPRPSTSRRWRPRRRSPPTSGRLRAARLPDRQAPAARGAHGVPARPAARASRPQRVHRVQAARQRLRDGRPRDAVPRAGHARRLRRALPGLRPRLLRLLRPDGDAEHGLADAQLQVLGVDERGCRRVFRTFNADAPAFRESVDARD